jgi:RNA polymerase-binding transcription factor DksA
MKAMEIDSSKWTDEMRQNAVRKLEEFGYLNLHKGNQKGESSIAAYPDGLYEVCDEVGVIILGDELTPTYEQLMAMTKEDVA